MTDSRTVVEWPVPAAILKSAAVANRNALAEKYRVADLDDVLRRYVNRTTEQIVREFGEVFRVLHPFRFEGRGFEAGAGVACFSAMVCREFSDVESIHAVEIVPSVVSCLQGRVVQHIAGEAGPRVTGVVGSFDDIHLPEESCDFCIEVDSLHHSDDLLRTLREIARKLKRGGHLVALDRAHSDALTAYQREWMLDQEYSAEWKRASGYPPERLTRRDNGEHEIRIGEWREALDRAGLSLSRWIELRPTGWRKALRAWLLYLPFRLRRKLDIYPYMVTPHPGEAWWTSRWLIGLQREHPVFRPHPWKHTLLVARKT